MMEDWVYNYELLYYYIDLASEGQITLLMGYCFNFFKFFFQVRFCSPFSDERLCLLSYCSYEM